MSDAVSAMHSGSRPARRTLRAGVTTDISNDVRRRDRSVGVAMGRYTPPRRCSSAPTDHGTDSPLMTGRSLSMRFDELDFDRRAQGASRS